MSLAYNLVYAEVDKATNDWIVDSASPLNDTPLPEDGFAARLLLRLCPDELDSRHRFVRKGVIIDLLRRLRALRPLLHSYVLNYHHRLIGRVRRDLLVTDAGAVRAFDYWLPDEKGYNADYVCSAINLLNALSRLRLENFDDDSLSLILEKSV